MVPNLKMMMKPHSGYPLPTLGSRCISENMSEKLLAKGKNQEGLPGMKVAQEKKCQGNLDKVIVPLSGLLLILTIQSGPRLRPLRGDPRVA